MPKKNARPLSGIKVLDVSRHLPGPLCSMILAELGAEVIKVEDPSGDPARQHPPLVDGVSAAYRHLNRGKKTLSIDLKNPSGLKRFYSLLKKSDVLIESFRPGVTKQLKIDFAQAKKQRPGLIYCSISGFGQTGQRAGLAGHDINYLALSGILEQMGGPQRPQLINFQIADISGALMSTIAILAALLQRKSAKKGRYLDISLMESALTLAVLPITAWQATGKVPLRGGDTLTGGIAAYNIYETRDGKFMAVGALEPKFWQLVCKTLSRPDLTDKGWLSGKRGQQVIATVAKIFKSKTQRQWMALFEPVDACVSPVLDFGAASDVSF